MQTRRARRRVGGARRREGAGSVRGAGGEDGMPAGVGGERERRTSRRSRAACPGVEEREDEGDLGPSSAGPQQKLGPGISASSNQQGLRYRCDLDVQALLGEHLLAALKLLEQLRAHKARADDANCNLLGLHGHEYRLGMLGCRTGAPGERAPHLDGTVCRGHQR